MNPGFSKQDKLFITIIALVHGVFYVLAWNYKRIYMGDSFEYIYEALNIKNLHFFYSGNPALPISPEYMTQRQPLYPLFLLGVYLFTINNWIVLIFQNLLSIFNIYYIRKIFTCLGYQKKYDWMLILFTVAYPAQFINANTIAPDILLQTFTLIYFGSFIVFIREKQLKYAIYMSLAIVAGMFVKPVLYPFTLVHIVILVFVGITLKMKLQRLVLTALFPICAVLTYNYWNYTRTGKFHFTSNQSFNAIYYYYSFFSARAGADSAGKFLAGERREIASLPEYADRYDYANERGIDLLKQNFFPYMAFHLKNTARIFIEPGKGELDLFTGKLTYGRLYKKEQTGFFATWKNRGARGMAGYLQNNPSLLFVVPVFLFNCFRLLGLYWFARNGKISWMARLFSFILIFYFAFAAGPIANTRYFLPVSLIVICCAVIGFTERMNKHTPKPIS